LASTPAPRLALSAWRERRRSGDPDQPDTGRDQPRSATPALIGLGGLAGGSALTALGLFFLKTGPVVFGSGLAIVSFMREGVVDQHHWLTNGQFLDAVAMGRITPGPVVISAGFIGYLVAGLPGAIVSSIAIFTPIYLGVVVPGRWLLRHRDNPQLRAFVTGATAAADLTTAAVAIITLALLWRFNTKSCTSSSQRAR
jgi:chromate transporter